LVYPQVHGILTSMQAQPHLSDTYVRRKLNLDPSIYTVVGYGADYIADVSPQMPI